MVSYLEPLFQRLQRRLDAIIKTRMVDYWSLFLLYKPNAYVVVNSGSGQFPKIQYMYNFASCVYKDDKFVIKGWVIERRGKRYKDIFYARSVNKSNDKYLFSALRQNKDIGLPLEFCEDKAKVATEFMERPKLFLSLTPGEACDYKGAIRKRKDNVMVEFTYNWSGRINLCVPEARHQQAWTIDHGDRVWSKKELEKDSQLMMLIYPFVLAIVSGRNAGYHGESIRFIASRYPLTKQRTSVSRA